MMKSKSLVKLANVAKKAGVALRKAAPHILIGTGAVSILGGVVTACISSTKIPEIMKDHEDRLNGAMTAIDATRETKFVYLVTIRKFLKLYAPAFAAIALGFVMIFGSHTILTNRNAMLLTQLSSVTQAFNAYREKVIDRFGLDVDQEFRHDDKALVHDDGSKEIFEVSETVDECVKYYCAETSRAWINNNIDLNLDNITFAVRLAQNKLDARGYLFLNELLEELHMDKTKLGYVVGWIAGPDTIIDVRPTVISGNIDPETGKCIYSPIDKRKIRLDLNVQGPIISKLDLPEE